MSAATHYEMLGVPPTASADEIKQAYRQLARQTHPDATGGKTDALFGLVTAAHQVLSDPARRAAYDRDLRAGTTPAEPPPDEPRYDYEPAPEPAPDFAWHAEPEAPSDTFWREPAASQGPSVADQVAQLPRGRIARVVAVSTLVIVAGRFAAMWQSGPPGTVTVALLVLLWITLTGDWLARAAVRPVSVREQLLIAAIGAALGNSLMLLVLPPMWLLGAAYAVWVRTLLALPAPAPGERTSWRLWWRQQRGAKRGALSEGLAGLLASVRARRAN